MMNFFQKHIFSFDNKNTENIGSHHHNNKTKEIEKDNEYREDFLNLNKNGDDPNKIIGQCCICLEDIYCKKKIIMSNCRHQLHIKCAKEWFYNNANCPLCRSEQKRLKDRICQS